MQVIETKRRSLVKTIIYRILMTTLSFGVTYLVLGEIIKALGLTAFLVSVHTFGYYLYERLWTKIKWGRKVVK